MSVLDRLLRRRPAAGKPPVYHYHLMKTGGTSINHAFCAAAYDPQVLDFTDVIAANDGVLPEPGRAVYMKLMRTPGHRLTVGAHTLAAFDKAAVERGGFTYGFAHLPVHQVNLPGGCFTFTILRDPLDRAISRFNHWHGLWRRGRLTHYHREDMAAIVEKGFRAFLDAVDEEEVAHQLHFFSADGDPGEALDQLRRVDLVLFNDALDRGVQELTRRTGVALELATERAKQTVEPVAIPEAELDHARELLEQEYRFVSAAIALRGADPVIARNVA